MKMNKKIEGKEAPPEDNSAKDENIETEEVKSNTMIDRANAAAQRMEDANTELSKLLAKQESMKVEETLGGTTEAGKQEKSKEELETESAKKMLEGTGYEDLFEPPKEEKK